jgi:hypothetical protein
MSRAFLSLAGFQLITIGRFWVITEEEARTIFPVHVHRRVPSRPTLRFAVVVQI